MQRTQALVLLVLSMTLAGCHSTGLSPREGYSRDFQSYLMAIYSDPALAQSARPALAMPAKVAVAQVGEVTPPQELVDQLADHSDLFGAVMPAPGLFDALPYGYNNQPTAQQVQEHARTHVATMQRFAADMGADYLFMYGGTVDTDSRENPLQVLDLTIVGAFVVPSRNVKGLAKASGLLVDVRSGRPVMLVTAQSEKSSLASCSGEDAEERRVIERLRREVIGKLGEQLVQRCQTHGRMQ